MGVEVAGNRNLAKALAAYCNAEIDDFRKSKLFIEIKALTEKLKYNIVCQLGKVREKKSDKTYLSVSIYNCENELVEIYDDGFLTSAVLLMSEDKQERFKFYSWYDEEFIDDMKWIIRNLSLTESQTDGNV